MAPCCQRPTGSNCHSAKSRLAFARLFSVLDGSRVHLEEEKKPSHDCARLGLYFTVINNGLGQGQHKNRSAWSRKRSSRPGLSHRCLTHQSLFPQRARQLGDLGVRAVGEHGKLVGSGRRIAGHRRRKRVSPPQIGYVVWSKLGFDAEGLEPRSCIRASIANAISGRV